MALNDIMARLAAGTPAPATPPDCASPADKQRWHIYRSIWTLTKTLKCSRCSDALEGRCKRGDERKARRRAGLQCFNPNHRQLDETREIVSIVIKQSNRQPT